MEEHELRQTVIEGQEARQTLERIEVELAELEDEWITRLKQCPADSDADRLMIQCQLNAIDGLRSQFAYKVDSAKMAEKELSLLDKARKKVNQLFG